MRLRALSLSLGLLALSAAAEPPPSPMPWVRAPDCYFSTSQVRLYGPNVVYAMTHLQEGCIGACQEGVWHTADLKGLGVPTDAKFAFLSGMVLVTSGYKLETSDIHVTFRHPLDQNASCEKYLGQAMTSVLGEGARSNLSTWVPLHNGEFQFCYTTTTQGNWPQRAAYGVNLSVQGFCK